MHPVLARRGRLPLYLAAWIPVAGLLAAALALPARRSWWEAAALAVPLALEGAFMTLAQWPMCRSMPLERMKPVRFLATHLAALAVSVGVWLLIGAIWARILELSPVFAGASMRYRRDAPIVVSLGALLFVAVTMLHYLMIAFENARDAERAALELEVQAREAELRALRAQLNPHFLFNGLNAVASLAGSDPARARTMCVLLADFLRHSLSLGARAEIRLSDELDLADRYLAIEQVRFGDRLRVEREVDAAAERCTVPTLLLQPLVENAITHGIAHSMAGGVVRVAVRRAAGRLEIVIENPADPDRPASRGHGVGVANVRARLASAYPGATRVESREGDGRYRVEITMPAEEPDNMDSVTHAHVARAVEPDGRAADPTGTGAPVPRAVPEEVA